MTVCACPCCLDRARRELAHAQALDELKRLRAALEAATARDPWSPKTYANELGHGFCACSECEEERAQGVNGKGCGA